MRPFFLLVRTKNLRQSGRLHFISDSLSKIPSGTKRGVVRSSGFVQRPVFHAYVVLLQIISRLVPRPEEFAEWLRRNLCIPDQEYVDSLILL